MNTLPPGVERILFTEEQIQRLLRYVAEPVVCFDGDRAGIKAAHRAIDRILPQLKSGFSFNFCFLPEGKDPVVQRVDQRDLQQAQAVTPDPEKTRTLGNELTVLEQFVGNVGRFNPDTTPGRRPGQP